MKITESPLMSCDPEDFYLAQDGKAPPVDVYGLAAKLGIVMDDSFTLDRLGYSGEIYWDGATPKVWINPADAKVRRRFTLAHEIGHFVLHMRGNPQSKPFKDDLKVMRRGGDWDYREAQANRFAAQLLMPHALIRSEISQMGVVGKTELAWTFEVSEESMGIRLKTLGYNF